MTAKAMAPDRSRRMPSCREIISHRGAITLDILTRFTRGTPAARIAFWVATRSCECRPTPDVKNRRRGTNRIGAVDDWSIFGARGDLTLAMTSGQLVDESAIKAQTEPPLAPGDRFAAVHDGSLAAACQLSVVVA